MKKLSAVILILILLLASSCQSIPSGPDYSDSQYWAYYHEGEDKPAYAFMVCPVVDMGRNGNLNMSLSDEDMKASFVGALNMEKGIYDDSAIIYAPFYRQMTFPVYSERRSTSGYYLDIAYSDICAAFEEFLRIIPEESPIILAGFSQGGQHVLALMKDYFDDPSLQERLIAAYCIGWRITEDDIEAYPHLKMAEGEKDTCVIISFNSEAADVSDSMIVPEGVRTLSINPLNWKTDSTYADKSLNIGACFTDYSGTIIEEIPCLTGAYIDPERGTLKVTDVPSEEYSSALFGDGVYHLYDYQFFFRNLEENVIARTEAWLDESR